MKEQIKEKNYIKSSFLNIHILTRLRVYFRYGLWNINGKARDMELVDSTC